MFYLIHKACVLLIVFFRKIDEACYCWNIQNYCRVGTAHPTYLKTWKGVKPAPTNYRANFSAYLELETLLLILYPTPMMPKSKPSKVEGSGTLTDA